MGICVLSLVGRARLPSFFSGRFVCVSWCGCVRWLCGRIWVICVLFLCLHSVGFVVLLGLQLFGVSGSLSCVVSFGELGRWLSDCTCWVPDVRPFRGVCRFSISLRSGGSAVVLEIGLSEIVARSHIPGGFREMFWHPEKVSQLRTGEKLRGRFRLFSMVILFRGSCFKILFFFGFRGCSYSEKEQNAKFFGQFRQKI